MAMIIHKKWASIKRAMDCECARIAAMKAKEDLSLLLQSGSISKRGKEVQHIAWTKEMVANNVLSDDFIDNLKNQVNGTHNLLGKITLKFVARQADPMMARSIFTGHADAIVSSDSDFAVYAGECTLSIKEFKFSMKDGKIDCIKLSTGDRTMTKEVLSCLHTQYPNSQIKFSMPRFPMFSGILCSML